MSADIESFFDQISKIPELINSFDRVLATIGLPTWGLAAIVIIALVSFVFSSREIIAWFMKTNSIANELVHLEATVLNLQNELLALRKELEASPRAKTLPFQTQAGTVEVHDKTSPRFPLDH